MRLQYSQMPQAGKVFTLGVTDVRGTARVEWRIDGVAIKVIECDDPPCYQRMVIPPQDEGRQLHIIARDDDGQEELLLPIAGTDTTPTAAVAM